MKCHLDPLLFDLVDSHIKDIEVRVNDLKRRKLKVGDEITFLKRFDEDAIIRRKVKELIYFHSFIEVVNSYEMKRIYLSNCSREDYIKLMRSFYTREEEEKYGVVAIIFE